MDAQLGDDLEFFGWWFVAALLVALVLDVLWTILRQRLRRAAQRRKWARIRTVTELREVNRRREVKRRWREAEAHGADPSFAKASEDKV